MSVTLHEREVRCCNYVLLDVCVSGTSTTDADADMIVAKVLLCKFSHVLVESC
jgi:hypothetical protein